MYKSFVRGYAAVVANAWRVYAEGLDEPWTLNTSGSVMKMLFPLTLRNEYYNPHHNQLSHPHTNQHNTTHLRQILVPALVIVVIHQVGFLHERPQPRLFQHLPERQELGELLLPHVQFDLELPEGERLACVEVRLDERTQDVELPRLDVDLQDVDVFVAFQTQVRFRQCVRGEGSGTHRSCPSKPGECTS